MVHIMLGASGAFGNRKIILGIAIHARQPDNDPIHTRLESDVVYVHILGCPCVAVIAGGDQLAVEPIGKGGGVSDLQKYRSVLGHDQLT